MKKTIHKKSEQGGALILVLFVMAILLVGAASMARVTQTSTLLAGNVATKEASRQAAEIGINTAFDAVVALADREVDQDGWYYALDSEMPEPSEEMWENAPVVEAGPYNVRYVVERLCVGSLPVTDVKGQCLVRKAADEGSAKAGVETIESPASVQFRISTQVTGPKGTTTVVQVLANR